jgi:hypothetical protein
MEMLDDESSDLPQLFDAAPGLYEACVEMVRNGHGAGCGAFRSGSGIVDCTCGLREAKKAIAYARGDDPLDVDKGEYEV